MKKTILSLIVIVFISLSTVVNAQGVKVDIGYTYGSFTEDFIGGIYDNYSGLEFSITTQSNLGWLGYGVFLKTLKATDGTPYEYGISGSASELKMNSWGPELDIVLSDVFKLYLRYGFLTVDESLDSEIGSASGGVKGYNFDLGVKSYWMFGEKFGLFGKVEYSAMSLNDMDLEGEFNSWNVGFGVVVRFQ